MAIRLGDAIRAGCVLLAITCAPAIALAQYPPGPVQFAPQGVGTSSGEITVTTVARSAEPADTVAVIVAGQGFERGPRSTCPTSLTSLTADCVITVVFTPTSLGVKTGEVVVSYGRCPCPQIWTLIGTGIVSPCDINADLSINVLDVQLIVNQALGVAPPTSDLNHDGAVNVVDVQLTVNALLGLGCRTS